MHSVFVPRIDAFHSVRNGRAVNWHWSSWQKHDRPRYVYDRAVSPDVHSCPTFCFYSFLLPVSIPFPSPPPPLRFPFSLLLDLFLPCFFFFARFLSIFSNDTLSRERHIGSGNVSLLFLSEPIFASASPLLRHSKFSNLKSPVLVYSCRLYISLINLRKIVNNRKLLKTRLKN